jgi:hypothetical protein
MPGWLTTHPLTIPVTWRRDVWGIFARKDADMTARRKTSRLPTLSALGWVLIYGLIFPVAAVASLKIITLKELVQKSDVIASGRLHAAPSTERHQLIVASLHPTSVLKGQEIAGRRDIPLCNREVDSEHPDLAKMPGDYVIFVAKEGECFYLVWGYDSIIPVRNGRALAAGIDDQPSDQPAQQFLDKIRSLVKECPRAAEHSSTT